MAYPYEAKRVFCSRLGSSWLELSDALEIKSPERSRFARGDEAHAIWEWLQERQRLDDLPDALRAVGRTDLANDLPSSTTAPKFTYFSLAEPAGERAFYDYLVQCTDRATQAIYRTGYGFHHERSSKYYDDLIRAEGRALERHVEIIRNQTGSRVAESWAEGYARLLERFEGRFQIKEDFENKHFSDIGMMDPHGHSPVVYWLIETQLPSSFGTETRAAWAVFIEHDRQMAAELGKQFVTRAKGLDDLTAENMRDLAKTHVYFAWGVHMATSRMHNDVPDARLRGTAVLHGWERNITAMLTGPANRGSISPSTNAGAKFDGVAYELSYRAKKRLDQLEGRSYRPVEVTVEIKGVPIRAFTYLPLPPSSRNRDVSRSSWIGLVIEGARENNVSMLIEELRSAGYQV